MNGGFLIVALSAVSVLTTLTVEGLKKIFNDIGYKYSANILAAIVAVLLSAAVMAGYVVYVGAEWTPQIFVTMIALMFLSFLGATTGWDKVVQAIEQLKRC